MQLIRMAGDCGEGRTCPTVYKSDRGTVVVQGYDLTEADLSEVSLPDGESAVEIPLSLLLEATRAHSQ